jgi:hypothetical protein
MTGAGPPVGAEPVRPALALVLAAIVFVALAIAGLGVTSLVLDADLIDVEGAGVPPAAGGMLGATAVFTGALWAGLRTPLPPLGWAFVTALGAWLGEIAGVAVGAGAATGDAGVAVGAAGAVAAGAAGLVVAGAGLLAGAGGVLLVRRRGERPRWPWERDEEE